MSKRLFTFGCSYTQYQFPTWADFLGLEFEHYENWGLSGTGCRSIAERLAECHARRNITKDDVVIIQWSTHLRHDFYTPAPIDNRTAMNWKTWGSVFSYRNAKIYDKRWFDTFFFEPGYIMHCLNHILASQLILESIGCTWYMTSIGHWPMLSSDLDMSSGAWEKRLEKDITIEKDFPELKFYLKPIWEDRSEKWISPIALCANDNQDHWWYLYDTNGDVFREQHPSPMQHAIWLNTYLRPKLGLTDVPPEQGKWISQLNAIKDSVGGIRESMEEVFLHKQQEQEYWPVGYWPRALEGFY
jgi:hypothetical protein